MDSTTIARRRSLSSDCVFFNLIMLLRIHTHEHKQHMNSTPDKICFSLLRLLNCVELKYHAKQFLWPKRNGAWIVFNIAISFVVFGHFASSPSIDSEVFRSFFNSSIIFGHETGTTTDARKRLWCAISWLCANDQNIEQMLSHFLIFVSFAQNDKSQEWSKSEQQ